MKKVLTTLAIAAIAVGLFAPALLAPAAALAQEPDARGVIVLPVQDIEGRPQRPMSILLPAPRDVVRRTELRDRGEDRVRRIPRSVRRAPF